MAMAQLKILPPALSDETDENRKIRQWINPYLSEDSNQTFFKYRSGCNHFFQFVHLKILSPSLPDETEENRKIRQWITPYPSEDSNRSISNQVRVQSFRSIRLLSNHRDKSHLYILSWPRGLVLPLLGRALAKVTYSHATNSVTHFMVRITWRASVS
jgi:hypothetical protein